MTDTKHELPEIDWSKPVEASFGGEKWFDVAAAMRGEDGVLMSDRPDDVLVLSDEGFYNRVPPHNIRNKPEPLELWVNVYPGMANMVAHKTKDQANECAEGRRIRCVRMVEASEQYD